MERLTLDEAIKYIKEVVCKNRKNKEKNTIVIPNSFISSADCAEKYEQVAKWLKELKSYKEAEEQGLLVRLPVPIGTIVYCIYTSMTGKNATILADRFTIDMCNPWGTFVFATKEEAEKKLEEMKNDKT